MPVLSRLVFYKQINNSWSTQKTVRRYVVKYAESLVLHYLF